MTSPSVAAFGRSLSFQVTRTGDRASKLRRVAAAARAQGDTFTADLVERNLRRIAGPALQLPRFA